MTMYILIHVQSSQLAYHTRFRRESGDLFLKGEGGGGGKEKFGSTKYMHDFGFFFGGRGIGVA